MSRSAKEATRFTATRPHAYSKPSPSSPISSGTPIGAAGGTSGPVETPAQKVARLRAQHNAKRASEITRWDRIVVRGRIIADAAHRITALGLVALTVVAGGVAVFSIGDMIIHNRRKRKIWYEEQRNLWQLRISEARAAAELGTADEDQILMLNQERARQEAAEAKKNKKGIFRRASDAIFRPEGLKKVDTGDASLAISGDPVETSPSVKTEVTELLERDRAFSEKGTVLQEIGGAVEGKRREGERTIEATGVVGGPLDKMAEEATTAASQKSKSWSSWFSRS